MCNGQRGPAGSQTLSSVLPTNQAAQSENLTAPTSPPSPPLPPSLPGCPSTLGPPWEDASPNPNQVTNMFPYASVGSRSGKFQRTLPQNKQLFAGGEQYVVLCML